MRVKIKNNSDEKQLHKKSIDELTHMFMDRIHEQTLKIIEGIEYLIDENFVEFENNLNYVIETKVEVEIKKSFEAKLWKKRSVFAKADRLKIFGKINDMKNIGEFIAHRLLLYKAVLPDEKFKLRVSGILKSLKSISNFIADAVKFIGTDLEKAHDVCEQIKDERRRMRNEEWILLNRLYNYSMDYLSRTFLYLKEMVEDIMMLADHIKDFAEYIQFLATKYLIFK
ncbi:hypothetical protein LCGC14_1519930 [marine sediment metagenome]|uniref:PhoU domain-containing protein n=1 Tax=marine sediment metagenome TaxID=412755 RepID=A0A0F9LEJ1_9ZZZZ